MPDAGQRPVIGTQAVIFRFRKISRAAVFDKSGDNPEQWQKQPPRGAAVLFVTHRAVWHEIGGSRLPKISTMGEALSRKTGIGAQGLFAKGVFTRKTAAFWRQYPQFYCAKMPARRSEDPTLGEFGQNRKNHRP